MTLIRHRINDIETLQSLPKKFGVEFDIHSYKNDLVLNHDPMKRGPLLKDFLVRATNRFCIFNIKQEGLELAVYDLIRTYKIERYFLLDCSLPSIARCALAGHRGFAGRISKYESFDSIEKMHKLIDWVWVDLFDDEIPLTRKEISRLSELDLKVCLVSPELRERKIQSVQNVQSQLKSLDWRPHAICIKDANLWSGF